MNQDPEQAEHAMELLHIHQRNLSYLEKQIALSGGEMTAPIHLLSQRDEIRAEIRRLESTLPPLHSDAIPIGNLLARLEGLLGRDVAMAVRAVLQQATPQSLERVIINGDGNIVGDNNTVIVVKDETLRDRLRQTERSISPRATTLLPPIRVFISSTMKDLQPEREAVERALASLDLEAVRAETIGSQSASPYEVSKMMAQQCDIYLGVYGGRYGTVVSGDGRSITEIEYHTARELGKPILIYRKKGILVEPGQDQFLKFVGDLITGHTWRDFGPDDVPGNLITWVQEDVRAEIERQIEQHPEWKQRRPARERLLLASLGLAPGAVTGLYHALARAGKPATRVVTFSPTNRDVRESASICAEEFHALGVPYTNHLIDAEDISSDGDAREFKSRFEGLLQEALRGEAEVLVGITGGRTIMGALMAIVAQTTDPDHVTLYHFDVDSDIEDEGRISTLRRLKYEDPDRYRELLAPPASRCRPVQVPYVRYPPSAAP